MAEQNEDFVTVASYSEVGEASVAQSVLDGAGIDSFLSGEEANILLPVSGARLQVRAEDAETARELLNNVPVFVANSAQGFLDEVLASVPDPITGNPDPAAQPESAEKIAVVSHTASAEGPGGQQ